MKDWTIVLIFGKISDRKFAGSGLGVKMSEKFWNILGERANWTILGKIL